MLIILFFSFPNTFTDTRTLLLDQSTLENSKKTSTYTENDSTLTENHTINEITKTEKNQAHISININEYKNYFKKTISILTQIFMHAKRVILIIYAHIVLPILRFFYNTLIDTYENRKNIYTVIRRRKKSYIIFLLFMSFYNYIRYVFIFTLWKWLIKEPEEPIITKMKIPERSYLGLNGMENDIHEDKQRSIFMTVIFYLLRLSNKKIKKYKKKLKIDIITKYSKKICRAILIELIEIVIYSYLVCKKQLELENAED